MARKQQTKKAEQKYMMTYRAAGDTWFAPFAFTASDDLDAKLKAGRWARYHSMSAQDVAARPLATHEADYPVKNEWLA